MTTAPTSYVWGMRTVGEPAIPRGHKISERVARHIVADISQRGLQPGDRLPNEAEMLAAFGVGRASLREALRILEVQGLVTIRPGPNGGPILSTSSASARAFGHLATLHFQFSQATFRHLIEARELLEPTLAAEAATRQDGDGLAALKAALDAEAAEQNGGANPNVGSPDFHRAIVAASGNRVLGLFAEALAEILRERLPQRVQFMEARADVHREHAAIANAIFTANAKKAERLSRGHIEAFSKLYVEEQEPGYLDSIIDWT